jgi:hypothetical protein
MKKKKWMRGFKLFRAPVDLVVYVKRYDQRRTAKGIRQKPAWCISDNHMRAFRDLAVQT